MIALAKGTALSAKYVGCKMTGKVAGKTVAKAATKTSTNAVAYAFGSGVIVGAGIGFAGGNVLFAGMTDRQRRQFIAAMKQIAVNATALYPGADDDSDDSDEE